MALRVIGNRNLKLNRAARGVAEPLAADSDRHRSWIGSHALPELTSEKVQRRLGRPSTKVGDVVSISTASSTTTRSHSSFHGREAPMNHGATDQRPSREGRDAAQVGGGPLG